MFPSKPSVRCVTLVRVHAGCVMPGPFSCGPYGTPPRADNWCFEACVVVCSTQRRPWVWGVGYGAASVAESSAPCAGGAVLVHMATTLNGSDFASPRRFGAARARGDRSEKQFAPLQPHFAKMTGNDYFPTFDNCSHHPTALSEVTTFLPSPTLLIPSFEHRSRRRPQPRPE